MWIEQLITCELQMKNILSLNLWLDCPSPLCYHDNIFSICSRSRSGVDLFNLSCINKTNLFFTWLCCKCSFSQLEQFVFQLIILIKIDKQQYFLFATSHDCLFPDCSCVYSVVVCKKHSNKPWLVIGWCTAAHCFVLSN